MKSELRLVPNMIVPNAKIVEIWYDNKFIGTIAGADGPGVRIISKFPLAYEGLDPIVTALAAVLRESTVSNETEELVKQAILCLPPAVRSVQPQRPNCLPIAIQTHL